MTAVRPALQLSRQLNQYFGLYHAAPHLTIPLLYGYGADCSWMTALGSTKLQPHEVTVEAATMPYNRFDCFYSMDMNLRCIAHVITAFNLFCWLYIKL